MLSIFIDDQNNNNKATHSKMYEKEQFLTDFWSSVMLCQLTAVDRSLLVVAGEPTKIHWPEKKKKTIISRKNQDIKNVIPIQHQHYIVSN